MTSDDWRPLAHALADKLISSGELTADWRPSFLAVPRHTFVPNFSLADAYADTALITQQRSAQIPGGGSREVPTSSASAPGVVTHMLGQLDARPGMTVLEIGTGTGYNAALLSHRLGHHAVTSVDIDPALVDAANTALADLGYAPTLAVANGADGLLTRAPFDRIIATCAVRHVPPAWIRQLAAGGRLVAPLDSPGGALLIADKTRDDEINGRIDAATVAFMPLRPDVDNPLVAHPSTGGRAMPHYGTSATDPAMLERMGPDLLLFLNLHIPGLTVGTAELPQGTAVTVSTPTATAHALTEQAAPDTWTVLQYGTHRLWDTVEHVAELWRHLGQPARTRFGVTATDDVTRQYVWLDDANGPYSWPLPL